MTPYNSHIECLLQQLCIDTSSDVAALGLVNFDSRKLEWQYVWGSVSARTTRIKQRITAGLTGEVLRTGSFIQLTAQPDEESDYYSESIIMTEKLLIAAAWPLKEESAYYSGVIITGKRAAELYKPLHMVQATKIIKQLEHIVSPQLLSASVHHCY